MNPSPLPFGIDLDGWLKRAATPWDAFPDTTGAKRDGETVGVAKALAHPNVTLETGALVTRLVAGADGRIAAVEYRQGGDAKRLSAGTVVLSAGAVNSAVLLLRSGLANRSDQVGRNFMNHNCSAVMAVAYLAPNRHRPNLTVRTGAQVKRLLVENGRATGVEMMDGTRIAAAAEVILSSGAIGSPRMLMLSGIGPAEHLADLGIRPLLDQPGVGANFQDHLDLFVIAEVTGPHTYDRYARPHWSAVAGLQYLLTRRGPVASSLFETGGFWYADKNARSPDIQFHLGLGSGIEAGVTAMPNGGVTLNSAYLRPRSRGTVRLATADPTAAPLIDPNYWQDPHDRAMSIQGLKLAQDIIAQPPLRALILAQRLPGPDVRTDQDYFDFACHHAKTDHHPAGTCRMGSDPTAVVGPRLRFNGIEGLRVADASILPTIVSSNTNAPTIMIAEKAADMIRADHQ